ncbi:TPA: TDT family transporter [Vibrio cholerae]
MIRAAKAKVMGAPTPMAGLALGIASLGWSWENMIAAHGVAQWVGAAIASVLLIVLAFKFLWHGHLLRQDLAHPVVGSVVPTFAMATMVVSASLGHFYPVAGDALWLFAVGLHILFLVSFLYHRAQAFELHHMVPSWFVPPVGIIVADVSFSGHPALAPIAYACLVFGMLAYAVMLPMMIYRFIFTHEIPDAAKPTLAFTRLLRLPFSPGYAAFTFPMVIGATALFKMAHWMENIGVAEHYVAQVHWLASLELIVATVVVSYVAIRYLAFYQPHKVLVGSR